MCFCAMVLSPARGMGRDVTRSGQPCADPAGSHPRCLDQGRAGSAAAGALPPLSFSYGLVMMLPSALGAELSDRVALSRRDDPITPDRVIDHTRPWRLFSKTWWLATRAGGSLHATSDRR